MRSLRLATVSPLLLALACTSQPTASDEDAGTGGTGSGRDGGGLQRADGGSTGTDGGPTGTDGGNNVSDAGSETSDDAGTGELFPDGGACNFANRGDPDRDRVVLLGHPFTEEPGVDGTEISGMTLTAAGTLTIDGVRVDVGTRPARITFVPSGAVALVLGEDGTLVSVEVKSAQELTVMDRVTLPSAGYGDLVVAPDGATFYAVGSNVAETSGISTVTVGCEGQLTVHEDAFFNLRLTDSLALTADGTRGYVLGGQAVFEPVDDNDVRLLRRKETGWEQVAAFDVFTDFIDTLRLALSPDGSTLVIPNGSAFSSEGGQVSVLTASGETLTESVRLTNLPDAREALFSADGQTALVSLLQPGKVVALSNPGTGWAVSQTVTGVGLAEQMAIVRRGALNGRVLVPSIDPNGGPNVVSLQITGPGQVEDLGQVELGSGSEQIVVPIAVME
ncbi:MAG: hypothetical protein AB2A00_19645 [Myxococcota bacterium]